MKTINIIDNGCDRYTIKSDCYCLGRRWDNLAEQINVIKPKHEENNICTMIVSADGVIIEHIVIGNEPEYITNVLSRYPVVEISFTFTNESGYVKNSEIKDFYFEEGRKPEDYVPVEPEFTGTLDILFKKGFVNTDAQGNMLRFYNAKGEIVSSVEISGLSGGKIDSISVNGVEQTIDENKNVDLKVIEEEIDPSVPSYVKAITQEDINSWNNKAETNDIPSIEGLATETMVAHQSQRAVELSQEYTDEKISSLIGSAPETLNTLEEVAQAIKDNESVVDALNSAIGNKVNKVSGKGLSTNDYTTEEKNKLSGLSNYNDTELRGLINNKADKSAIPTNVSQLTNDSNYLTTIPSEYITESELTAKGYATTSQVSEAVSNKVDKVSGKSLIADSEITRLSNVTNYDDTSIRSEINAKASIQDMTNYIEQHKDELKGDKGDAGVSATHSWSGTTLTITSASGSSSANLKGDKGDKGDTYSLTDADKQDISELVEVNIPTKVSQLTNDVGYLTEVELTDEQLNDIVEQVTDATKIEVVYSVDEMTDTSKQYVLASTGTIWAYKETTYEQEVEVKDEIKGTVENPYVPGRLSSDGSVNTDAANTHVLTPYIDLKKYEGKQIEIHLNGNRYMSETAESFIMHSILDNDMNVIYGRMSTIMGASYLNTWHELVSGVIHAEKSATLTIIPPMHYASGATYFRYVRFCGLGSESTSDVYITYKDKQIVTEEIWSDTGVNFGGNGGSVDSETLAKIESLNNEGADPNSVTLLPQPVLDFYNREDYPDNDYTISYLSKITYPCRADIPVPYTIKWNYNENAMRTTVAVDTKAIGLVNNYTMYTYDATGLNKYPLYNLIPGETYFYKVTHVLSNGSLVEAKTGSFTTSNETIRLMYIDGTQNVRDLGGWIGLGGKKVKYGKIFRGASLSDSSFPGLMLTGKGRLAFGELNVQAELNLGAIDNETSIAANCSYKKIGYSNYAQAIINETARANFKVVLEYIVSCLDGTLVEGSLYQVERNIYMHCQGGCDRTGTLAFQLLGLLGVSESDLAKEYELSSFSNIGFGRLRTTRLAVDTYDYAGMVEEIKKYNGNTITDKFYDFAVNGCGVAENTIISFRNLMLE